MMRKAAAIALGLFLAGVVCLAQAQIPNVKFLGSCSQLGNDQFTKLLVHADGTNGSNIFRDSSPAARVVTAAGAAQVDTSQKVFGTGSANFGAVSGNYLTSPATADWNLGTGAFTFDFRFRPTSTPSLLALAQSSTGAGSTLLGYGIFLFPPNGINFTRWNGDGGSNGVNVTTAPALTVNVWHHLAIARVGATWGMFQNGASQTISNNGVGAGSIPSSGDLRIGSGATTATFGSIDEFRLSNVSRWGSSFPVPVAAYCP